jgi:hypothetical protein
MCRVGTCMAHVPRLSQLCHVTEGEINANTITQVARPHMGHTRLVHRVWIVCNVGWISLKRASVVCSPVLHGTHTVSLDSSACTLVSSGSTPYVAPSV